MATSGKKRSTLNLRQIINIDKDVIDMPIFFYLFSALIILSSIGVITSRNPVYAVLWLIFTFLNSSAIFIQLGAEFIAMSVIIVYVGAVAVLFLFVVMMLNIDFGEARERLFGNRLVSMLIMGALITDLILIIKSSLSKGYITVKAASPIIKGSSNAHAIGEILYTEYFVAFELAGLVLLLAMVSSIVLTLRKREGVKKQNVTSQLNRDAKLAVKTVKVKLNEGVDGIIYK